MPLRPLYNCVVQLNGSRDHTVSLSNVTAAEIRLLQWLHGRSENSGVPVINVVDTEHAVERSDAVERERLALKYSAGELHGQALVEKLFGVIGVPLPMAYEPEAAAEHAEVKDLADEKILPVAKPSDPRAPRGGEVPELSDPPEEKEDDTPQPVRRSPAAATPPRRPGRPLR